MGWGWLYECGGSGYNIVVAVGATERGEKVPQY